MIQSTNDLRSYIKYFLHIYPGVPLVSQLLFCLYILAIPKSVMRIYPLESKTKFSGFISLCIILLFCKSSNPNKMHAIKNSINQFKIT